ncbi:hypothetical protein MFMK1_003014 [Metallumcola ferriviriculae]|uniref:Uncharacterized protein n=1 Tax=Metallumcola ferriviriculae TaxID=3039180 RepID=A0AAU0USD7_9FIRM|nr:hypothetical protein MFMK1_003014 [Desulfitibacteraceae bacterium MK1]
MRKLKIISSVSLLAVSLFAFSGNAFAANMVSKMAVEKGGQAVAQCAQTMDKGVSQCAAASSSMTMEMQ